MRNIWEKLLEGKVWFSKVCLCNFLSRHWLLISGDRSLSFPLVREASLIRDLWQWNSFRRSAFRQMRDVQRSLFLYLLILRCVQLTVILILQWCILDPFASSKMQYIYIYFFFTKIGDGLVLAYWLLFADPWHRALFMRGREELPFTLAHIKT